MHLRRLSILPAILIFAATLSAQTLPQGVSKGPSMAGITEYTYPNGLRVLLLPDSGSSTITVNIVYLVGSRHEGYGETGMAHLLEHMNFIKSTHDRNIKKELEDHGARWNGTTYYDRTNYYETVNASDENLRWALGLEAERMVNMRIEKPLLDTEMTVVRNEFERGENSVRQVLEERVLSTAYLWHNYGKSTIGSRADIERVPIDRLAAFYQQVLPARQRRASRSPARSIRRRRSRLVARTLGAIPRPTRKLDETYTVEPPQDGERIGRTAPRRQRQEPDHRVSLARDGASRRGRARSDVPAFSPARGGVGPPGQGARRHEESADRRTCPSQELHDPGSGD